jgi:hypothetical protein
MSKVLTPARRARLEKLAAYLEKLPTDYSHFGMATWLRATSGEDEVRYALHNGGVPSCGTAACAVGHGPAAGILVPRSMITKDWWGEKSVDWHAYSERFLGKWEENRAAEIYFDWLFGEVWSAYDNHHHGAAARIRYVLDNGAPPEGFAYAGSDWLPEYARYRVSAEVATA